jgi:hypothetical protein
MYFTGKPSASRAVGTLASSAAQGNARKANAAGQTSFAKQCFRQSFPEILIDLYVPIPIQINTSPATKKFNFNEKKSAFNADSNDWSFNKFEKILPL